MNAVEVLEFERIWWRQSGTKENAIREKFGVSPIRYYQQVNQLLDELDALSIDPVLVYRLRRLRIPGWR